MSSDNLDPRETEERSIKSRKGAMFVQEPRPVEPEAPRKSFQEYLRTTPAAPLAQGVKLTLYVAAGLVVLLLLGALFAPRSKSKRPEGTGARPFASPVEARRVV